MPLTVHASTGPTTEKLVLTTGGQFVTDRYGMSNAKAVWWYHGPAPENQVAIFSNHPRWSFLEMDKRTITRAEDGHWDIVGDYYGVQGFPEPIYALDICTGQEPIETHPEFATFAGRPGSELNGAVFDPEDDTFVGFKQVVSGGNVTNVKWVGVRAYLNATATWRETRITKTRPSSLELSDIGTVDTPSGGAPTPTGRNWLFGSISYEQKGKTYTIRREWLLSGPGGWNETIYN